MSRQKPRKLPKKLPKHGVTALGPVKIVWVSKKEMKKLAGQWAWGLTVYAERTIYLNELLRGKETNPILMWKTFHHEMHHIHMEDAGLNQLFRTDQRELICETYAQAKVFSMMYEE